MLDSLIEAIISTVFGYGIDGVAMRIRGIADKTRLRKELEDQLKRQFDTDLVHADRDSEIDYGGLCAFLEKGSGANLLMLTIFDQQYSNRNERKASLLVQCMNHAHATTCRQKEKVDRIVNILLGTIQDFFLRKTELTDNAAFNNIVSEIIKYQASDTRSIHDAINNLIALLPELMERPIDLKTDENPEEFTGIHRCVYRNPYGAGSQESYSIWDALEEYRHIILLAEAGAGKSVTLQETYVEAVNRNCIPIHIKLKNYPRIPGLQRLFESQKQISSDHVLIMDGLDEITSEQQADFFKAMNAAKQNLANKRIIISTRLNAYRYQGVNRGQLEGFETMFFVPLSQDDQEEYANIMQIDYSTFIREATAKMSLELCKNFFYLSNLIEIWKLDHAIPDPANILERIAILRFKKDIDREYEDALEEHQYDIFKELERAALVMQCMQTYQLENINYQALITKDIVKDLIKRTGFWIKDKETQWKFSHNIMQEYFAARKLEAYPFEEVLGVVSMPHKQLRPSWMNAFSLLCQIRPNGEEERWAIRYDLDAILSFERNNYSQAMRDEVFVQLMEQHERDETWVGWYPETMRKLAEYASSMESFQYLLSKLTDTTTDRHILNVMRVLQGFTILYDLDTEVESILLNIACATHKHEAVRAEAIRTLIALEIFNENVLKALVSRYEHSDELNVLAGIYEYILATGKSASFIQLFLHGLGVCQRSETIYISAQTDIKSGLEQANTIEDLQLILEYFQHNPGVYRIYGIDAVLITCCKTAADLYSPSAQGIITRLVGILQKKWHYREITTAVQKFMIQTKTEGIFFSMSAALPDDSYHHLIPEALMSQSLAEYLVAQYQQGVEAAIDVLSWYANRMRGDETWYARIDDAIYLNTNQHIPPNSAVRYQDERAERNQRYFDTLFNRQQYQQLIHELVDNIGEDIEIKNLIDCISKSDYWQYADLQQCADDLRQALGFDSTTLLSECLDKLSWEQFSIVYIKESLGRNSEALHISPQQKDDIAAACLKALNSIDLEHAVTITERSASINEFTVVILQLMEKQDVECTEEQFLSMLMIPPIFFNETQRNTFPQYITDHLEQKLIEEQVMTNLKDKVLHGDLAISHLLFCLERNIGRAIPYVTGYLLSEDKRDSDKWVLLKAFYNCRGAAAVLALVGEQSISNELLQAITGIVPINEFSAELDQKIQEAYEHSQDEIWYRLMLERGKRSALEEYYQRAKDSNSIPDYYEGNRIGDITSAIATIANTDALDVLEKLLILCHEEGFRDDPRFGLRNSLTKVFTQIASNRHGEVVDCLQRIKNEHKDNQNLRLFAIDLLEDIRLPAVSAQDTSLSFKEACQLLASLES